MTIDDLDDNDQQTAVAVMAGGLERELRDSAPTLAAAMAAPQGHATMPHGYVFKRVSYRFEAVPRRRLRRLREAFDAIIANGDRWQRCDVVPDDDAEFLAGSGLVMIAVHPDGGPVMYRPTLVGLEAAAGR
jgi:hypothetical protein